MILFISILISLYLIYSFVQKNLNRSGPIQIPIFGSLLFLGDKPHLTLTNWSKKYGRVYDIFMGDYHTIVISDPVVIRNVWLKNFESFTDRPHLPSYTYLSGDYHDLSTSDYKNWKHNRSVVSNAFTKSKLKSVETHIDNQCSLLLKRMSEIEKSNEIFYPKNHLKKYSMNIIMSMVFNEQISYDEGITGRFYEQLIKPNDILFEFLGAGNILDYIKILEPLSTFYVKHTVGEEYNKILNFLDELKKEHLKNIDPEKPRDLFDNIISSKYIDYEDKNIQGIAADMLTAGTDTSASTLNWFFLYMCNNPHIQEKAYNEVRSIIGDAKIVKLSDRINLPYVQAVIKEVLRIKPIAPLGVPRACVQDIEIGNLNFKKGDHLLMNIYALHHDEQYWSEPDRFLPERFIGNNHSEYWLPFSIGPRNCVGLNLANDSTFIACANILSNFKIKPKDNRKIDDGEVFGLTIHPNDYGIILESR